METIAEIIKDVNSTLLKREYIIPSSLILQICNKLVLHMYSANTSKRDELKVEKILIEIYEIIKNTGFKYIIERGK